MTWFCMETCNLFFKFYYEPGTFMKNKTKTITNTLVYFKPIQRLGLKKKNNQRPKSHIHSSPLLYSKEKGKYSDFLDSALQIWANGDTVKRKIRNECLSVMSSHWRPQIILQLLVMTAQSCFFLRRLWCHHVTSVTLAFRKLLN